MADKKQAQQQEKNVVVIARPPGSNWARVVFGALVDRTGDTVTLKDARQALYYARDSGGELGLAAQGPQGSQSRITAVAPRVEVSGVSLFMECTEAASAAWKNAPVYAGKQ